MEDSLESIEKPVKRKLRWHQFSLRSLLIFVTLFGVACSWFAVKMGQAKRQKQIVEILEKYGCGIEYDGETHTSNEWFIEDTLAPKWLQDWLGLDFFSHVSCVIDGKGMLTDENSVCLKGLTHLKSLLLSNSQLTDTCLENIKEL